MSALPLIATKERTCRHVSNVPTPEDVAACNASVGALRSRRNIIILAIGFPKVHEPISCWDPFLPQSSAFACRPRVEVGQRFSGPQYVRDRRAFSGRRRAQPEQLAILPRRFALHSWSFMHENYSSYTRHKKTPDDAGAFESLGETLLISTWRQPGRRSGS